MTLQIRRFHHDDTAKWDEYVLHHPHGSPFHLTAWKRSMEDTFGYRSHCLLAERDQSICGVLPLFLVSNLVMGRVLLSSPFAVYGGILADTDEARTGLFEEARALAVALRVQYAEFRNAYPEQCVGLPRIDRYVTFTLKTNPEPEAVLGALEKKTRNLVRKSLRSPFRCREQSDLGEFERLYSQNMRRLGTPSFPKRHFVHLMRHFGEMVNIREVVLEDRVVAASFNFYFRGQMHTYYAASDPDYLALVPNNFLYYDHICWAGQNGFPVFDFGRSKKGTGTFDFKRHWGATMRELPYEVLLVKRKALPNFSPANPRFGLAIKVWQRLPLAVTRAVGPWLIRMFP